MAKDKVAWGIDVGQCALRALALRAAGDNVEVVDHAYIEHEAILSAPEVDRHALLNASMRKLLDDHDLSNAAIGVSVPGRHTLARFTKLPPVDARKLPDLVTYEAQQQIPFDLADVLWDYQVFTSEEPGAGPEVGIFAMRRDLLRDHLRVLSDVGLEPTVVQSGPLALYNAACYDGLAEGSVVLVDIGVDGTDLVAVDGSSLWTRTIPLGGRHFTEALVETFKVSFNKAEHLKRSAAGSRYARQLFQAMRPVFSDLVAELQRSLGFYTSSRRGVKLTRLLAFGGAFQLPGLVKYIQQNLGLSVERPSFKRLSAARAPAAAGLIDRLNSFGVAYGLALQGLELAAVSASLLPPDLARQIIWRKKTPWFYAATACLVAGAAVVWGRNLADQRVLGRATGAGQPPPPPPASIEAASQIIEQGPRDDLCPRYYADQIVKADEFLLRAKAQAQQENEELVNKLREIEELQAQKAVWPLILNAVHGALPPLDDALARAIEEGPEAFKRLVESNPEKYARPNRPQIFIDKFESEYSPDVFSLYEAQRRKLRGETGPGPGTPAPTTSAQPGFLIQVTGRTPYAAGDRRKAYAFLREQFMARIPEEAPRNLFYFARRHLMPIRQAGSASVGRITSGLGRLGPGWGPGMRAGGDVSAATEIDPVTGESMAQDWRFEMLLAVVLGPKPAEAATDAPGN